MEAHQFAKTRIKENVFHKSFADAGLCGRRTSGIVKNFVTGPYAIHLMFGGLVRNIVAKLMACLLPLFRGTIPFYLQIVNNSKNGVADEGASGVGIFSCTYLLYFFVSRYLFHEQFCLVTTIIVLQQFFTKNVIKV